MNEDVETAVLGDARAQRGGMLASAAAGVLVAAGSLSFVIQDYASNGSTSIGIMTVVTGLSLAAILLGVRSILKGAYGDATAWSAVAIPVVLVLVLLALPVVHLSLLFGGSCDQTTIDCNQPLFGYRLALLLYVVAVILLLRAIGRSRAATRVKGS